MEIEQLSKIYEVRKLEETDIPTILSLYQSNPLYFEHYPPSPSLDSVKEDMERLPSGKTAVDKFYVGFWEGQDLIAVMDFVRAYPNDKTLFIGLFMVDQAYQGRGIGRKNTFRTRWYLIEKERWICKHFHSLPTYAKMLVNYQLFGEVL